MTVMIDHLSTYLQDHRAGAEYGVTLARRLYEENVGTPYEGFLGTLADEIDEDVGILESIMERFEVDKATLKTAGAKVGEKLSRLKPNNALTEYSALSRVLEMEQLRAGIQGKLSLWDALSEAAPCDERLDAVELANLVQRAELQLAGLREQHRLASREAFAPA
ncbi:MAG: hypothetical protein QOK16_1331 [Solirubrobacteraceae bacterium]|jgi:hypothetical protein|nr:hypothetical protein [Solirubrobacteraceae bacterium]